MLFAFKKSLNQLVNADDRILIAVSGGIDSVVLTHLLYSLYRDRIKTDSGKLYIAHCNFQLRGDDSVNDELFVKNFGKELGIPVFSKRFDVEIYKKEHHCSTQMAARELRYQYFDQLMDEHDITYTAIAHHQDDQIETFFINLLRGAGVKGLRGMLEKQGRIIRPMLGLSRKAITAYADEHGLSHCEDITNAETKYLRNQIRHELIPLLEKIDPHAKASIVQSIDNLRASEEEGLEEFCELSGLGFSPAQIRNIRKAKQEQSGKQFLSKTHRLVVNRGELVIEPYCKKEQEQVYFIKDASQKQIEPIHLIMDKINAPVENLNLGENIAFLDYEKLEFPLVIRRWKEGDYFSPLGMNGKQKLSDFFINQKQSLLEKEKTWLLCSGDNIVWVIGHRINHHFRYVKGTTKSVLKIEYKVGDLMI